MTRYRSATVTPTSSTRYLGVTEEREYKITLMPEESGTPLGRTSHMLWAPNHTVAEIRARETLRRVNQMHDHEEALQAQTTVVYP